MFDMIEKITPDPMPICKTKWHTCELDDEGHHQENCNCEEIDFDEYQKRFGQLLCSISGTTWSK